ncbi:MAG TPA: triose-phosphate isomerase [Steroidobacteraceae bacterium]|jgi:triosephosphate isomerase|nr:triose-phosphate isomerase [Steroidobacteraceae bacterium]
MNPALRKPLVAGNWKMHGSRAEAVRLVEGILASSAVAAAAEVVVCPPFVYLADVARLLAGSPVALGGQDVCAEEPGPHTGEVAASMLADVGCRFAIVGHSERRAMYGEGDELVARKFVAAGTHGLVPVLCVGETLDEREGDATRAVILRQLDAVLATAGISSFGKAVVAYEPVWAIGTGRTASPAQAQEVHALIRGRIAEKDATIAASLRVLYGGSVKAANAAELFAMADVDGGLIGGASLKADEFAGICAAAGC